MINYIKRLLHKDYTDRARKFELSRDSLKAFGKLKPSSQDLLLDMVEKVGAGLNVEDLIVTGDYKDFGFKHKQAFYRCKKELSDAMFIVYQGQDHYVNPVMLGYNTRRQIDCFHRIFKIKVEAPVNMGQFNK